MVVDESRQIRHDLFAVRTDGQHDSVLDVALYQHHSVRLAEAFGRGILSFGVLLHLFLSESRPVKITLHSRTFECAGLYAPFAFENVDDLIDRSRRNLALELYCLRKQRIEVLRQF